MTKYEAPALIELGSLHDLTLAPTYPGGTITKAGGGADVLTALTGLGGTFTVTS